MTSDLITASPTSWEPHDTSCLPEGDLKGMLNCLLHKIMVLGVPLSRRADFECSWTAWTHDMDSLMTSNNLDPCSLWSI